MTPIVVVLGFHCRLKALTFDSRPFVLISVLWLATFLHNDNRSRPGLGWPDDTGVSRSLVVRPQDRGSSVMKNMRYCTLFAGMCVKGLMEKSCTTGDARNAFFLTVSRPFRAS